VEVILISLATTPSLFKRIYKWLILVAVYHTNPLVTAPDLYLVLALYLVSTTYKDKVTINVLEEPLSAYY